MHIIELNVIMIVERENMSSIQSPKATQILENDSWGKLLVFRASLSQ